MRQQCLHYKGGRYEIIGHGREEATREPIVVYRAIENHGWEDLYTRPHSEFYGTVKVGSRTIPRFTLVDENGEPV